MNQQQALFLRLLSWLTQARLNWRKMVGALLVMLDR
jgi:hypothetical protein